MRILERCSACVAIGGVPAQNSHVVLPAIAYTGRSYNHTSTTTVDKITLQYPEFVTNMPAPYNTSDDRVIIAAASEYVGVFLSDGTASNDLKFGYFRAADGSDMNWDSLETLDFGRPSQVDDNNLTICADGTPAVVYYSNAGGACIYRKGSLVNGVPTFVGSTGYSVGFTGTNQSLSLQVTSARVWVKRSTDQVYRSLSTDGSSGFALMASYGGSALAGSHMTRLGDVIYFGLGSTSINLSIYRISGDLVENIGPTTQTITTAAQTRIHAFLYNGTHHVICHRGTSVSANTLWATTSNALDVTPTWNTFTWNYSFVQSVFVNTNHLHLRGRRWNGVDWPEIHMVTKGPIPTSAADEIAYVDASSDFIAKSYLYKNGIISTLYSTRAFVYYPMDVVVITADGK